MTICRCEEVLLSEIYSAIQNGAKTPRDIKLSTRAGMGICQGKTCRPIIEHIMSDQKPSPLVRDLKHRYPVRPVLFEELMSDEECKK